jgi:uncharacterized protein YbjT (DUF2867 family)
MAYESILDGSASRTTSPSPDQSGIDSAFSSRRIGGDRVCFPASNRSENSHYVCWRSIWVDTLDYLTLDYETSHRRRTRRSLFAMVGAYCSSGRASGLRHFACVLGDLTMTTRKLLAVSGATGFIGRNLVNTLLAEGREVRALVRRPGEYDVKVDARRADVLDQRSLFIALGGVHTAYYLVHSMRSKGRDFAETDRLGAENFLKAAENAGVRRIIYLGGLGEPGPSLSEHLRSRAEVGRILQSGQVQTTVLRAAIIIGPGSASWDMLRQLADRLPVMTTPRWVETRCQPIALRDVLGYLIGCAEAEGTAGETFDIGGPDVLTYRQMLMQVAELLGKHARIYGIPILSPRLSSYWVDLVTDVPSSIARPLIDGLRSEVICRDDRIKSLVPLKLTSFREAVSLALSGRI